ncbi:MAG: phosphoribosylglycinamide formyltransferase [Tannerella sp.]|jgi:phosphoribosylglycinamide formyltransferase-1|nr:phosphoribosylglycinamide formyltransferase [Tannerella sp.]
MKNIAILASGSGTNAENIIRYFAKSDFIRVAVILSNKRDAGVHERAKSLNIPSFTFSNAEFKEGAIVLNKLAEYNIDFIVSAGFLSMISPVIIGAYRDRIINIHPALLPKFGGKGMYGHYVHEAVIAAKEMKTGITIHYVNERYDEGAVIFQATCPVSPEDRVRDIEKKVHELEYEYYPQAIEKLLNKYQE